MEAPDDDDVMSLFQPRDFQGLINRLTIPEGLSPMGQKVARAIQEVVHETALDPAARVFYTPQEWAALGNKQGQSADLIVCLSGGMDTADARSAIEWVLDRIKMSALPLPPNALGVYPQNF